mmetsp:Transcript_37189/g.93360  ORF Transcript_37189/g.93360 Transcript_37189/m.93360 type:complete len:117 (-) Transcript_37189:3792-4142(-)
MLTQTQTLTRTKRVHCLSSIHCPFRRTGAHTSVCLSVCTCYSSRGKGCRGTGNQLVESPETAFFSLMVGGPAAPFHMRISKSNDTRCRHQGKCYIGAHLDLVTLTWKTTGKARPAT